MTGETIIWVHFDTWSSLPVKARETLIEIYAECFSQGSDCFYSRLPNDDPRSGMLLQALARTGLKPWRQLDSKRQNEFTLAHVRSYDSQDLESPALLEPLGHPTLHDYCGADETGNLWVKPSFFKKKQLMTDGDLHSLLISADIRAALESGGFSGMVFKPVGSRKALSPGELENLWELTSDQRMPPLSDYCTFYDRQENLVKGSDETAYQYIEDFYPISELHYNASAVKDWPWDFALTHELFWYSEKRHRRRVVTSKRFYDFCLDNKLKMNWIPVRIDPD